MLNLFRKTIIVSLILSSVAALAYHFNTTIAVAKTSNSSIHPQAQAKATEVLKDGDLVFQTSASGQSKAIQLATHSKYSHCGIVFIENGKAMVYEAVQPVKITPLTTWVKQGDNAYFVVRRLTNRDHVLTQEVLKKMKTEAMQHLGKDYDLTFEWNDTRMYCSEYVWKIYQRGTGLTLGATEALRNFDLSHPLVKQKLQERYGDQLPLDEAMISPAAVFNSTLLTTVAEN